MHSRIRPTTTVYPCRLRSEHSESNAKATLRMWVTWEAIEREHFSPVGSLMADFSRPLEVDPALVRDHRYVARLKNERLGLHPPCCFTFQVNREHIVLLAYDHPTGLVPPCRVGNGFVI